MLLLCLLPLDLVSVCVSEKDQDRLGVGKTGQDKRSVDGPQLTCGKAYQGFFVSIESR